MLLLAADVTLHLESVVLDLQASGQGVRRDRTLHASGDGTHLE